MSQPCPPPPAKLLVGFFLKEAALAADVVGELQARLGAVDMLSNWFQFNYTDYYQKEMGAPLQRRLVVFKALMEQDRLVAIKHMTNQLERRYQRQGRRRVNIDPGYLLAERLVLATGKNFTHRIFIGQGIYADLTLVFQKGAFRPLPWTYPDYADRRLIDFLTLVRKKYRLDLKYRLARNHPPDFSDGGSHADLQEQP